MASATLPLELRHGPTQRDVIPSTPAPEQMGIGGPEVDSGDNDHARRSTSLMAHPVPARHGR